MTKFNEKAFIGKFTQAVGISFEGNDNISSSSTAMHYQMGKHTPRFRARNATWK